MKKILGLWLLFYIPTTLAKAYTCVYKGNTVYQSKPCAGTVAKNNINYSQKSLTDRQKYEQWKSTREPKVGMSGDQVIKTIRWGAPEKKRSFSSNRGKDELWYYPELGLISLKNGVVTSISQ